MERSKRLTEREAARIERRIELLRADGRHADADREEDAYWDRCNLSPDIRRQLMASRRVSA